MESMLFNYANDGERLEASGKWMRYYVSNIWLPACAVQLRSYGIEPIEHQSVNNKWKE